MQEVKKLVRFLFVFLMRPLRLIFREIPLFERAGRALFRRFPKLRLIYTRLMPPLNKQNGASSVLGSLGWGRPLAQTALPRNRPLTPHASMIYSDLQAAVRHNKTVSDSTRLDSASTSKGQS